MMSFKKVQFLLSTANRNLLNSLPRGNLVDGLPRAASFVIEVLVFDGDHFKRGERSRC